MVWDLSLAAGVPQAAERHSMRWASVSGWYQAWICRGWLCRPSLRDSCMHRVAGLRFPGLPGPLPPPLVLMLLLVHVRLVYVPP